MALTEQKRRYADARLSGASKREAAISAGCPEKTASQAASRYEKDPDVVAAVDRKRAVNTVVKSDPPNGDLDPHITEQVNDPLKFFEQVMNNAEADPKLRLEAAKALASFTVAKPGESGKKEQREKKAAEVMNGGKFSPRTRPNLKVV
ncbi:hypothetical protein [Brucella pseudogrignonensis]|uniref:Phage terminase small subunit n=1 Tax=Brucella pseudogrignonensis TaxID=419475 RepID=A0ABU1M854_9HYPH|nr:hypothetical protein [Brucella pseudogrignonensis]MDR6432020.1 phage terminase small subunit [Brucella pseudogrignonensis]